MITITSTQAQNSFGEVLDAAQREPIAITRQGKPMAYIISPQGLQKLLASQEEREKAVLAYQAYLELVRKKATPETNALNDEDINRLVHELR